MYRKPKVKLNELAEALIKRFGPGYIPHKLSEECSELAIALHKLIAISRGFSFADADEKSEIVNNIYEEMAHVKVFLSLMETPEYFNSPLELSEHMKERYERLEKKITCTE